MLKHFISQALRDHPLPWTIRRNWSHEVVAADGAIVVKCGENGGEDAEAIIAFADFYQKEMEEVTRGSGNGEKRGDGRVTPLPLPGQPDIHRVAGAFRRMTASGEDAALRAAIAAEGDPENKD